MATISLKVGTYSVGNGGIVQDATRPVEFEGDQVVIRVCEPDVRALLLALQKLTRELRATGADGQEVRGESR